MTKLAERIGPDVGVPALAVTALRKMVTGARTSSRWTLINNSRRIPKRELIKSIR